MYRLLCKRTQPFTVSDEEEVLLGRGEECDLILDDPTVSRAHCRVIAHEARLIVTDLQSRWGTHVNGQQVEAYELKNGDRLQIGETTLVVECVQQSGASPPSDAHEDIRNRLTITPSAGYANHRHSYVIDEQVATHEDKFASFSVELFLGQQFATYRVDSVLSQGNHSLVFRAKEQPSDRLVALRIFSPGTFEDQLAERRFQRAAATTRGLRHPNIVRLLNAGRTRGLCYTASQLVEGESAVDLIRRIGVVGMLDSTRVLQIAIDLCEALRFVESHGILHRNIKPSNVLTTETGDRKIALLNDLVLAKPLSTADQQKLTQAGELLGDIGYMSPEQLGSGHKVDCRSDIYQLGVTLFALLTGKELFSSGRPAERIRAVLMDMPEPIRMAHLAIPPQFENLVFRMLKKNPAERFQNAEELSVALRKVASELGQSNIRPIQIDPNDEGWSGALDGIF